MNTRSLKFRLVAWYAGVLTAVFVLLGVLTIFFLQRYLEANLLDTQARRARQIAGTLIPALSRSDEGALPAQVEKLYSPEASDRFIRITRADGQVVYVSGLPKDERYDPAQVPAATAGVPTRKVHLPDSSLLVAAIAASGADGTPYVVEVGA